MLTRERSPFLPFTTPFKSIHIHLATSRGQVKQEDAACVPFCHGKKVVKPEEEDKEPHKTTDINELEKQQRHSKLIDTQ